MPEEERRSGAQKSRDPQTAADFDKSRFAHLGGDSLEERAPERLKSGIGGRLGEDALELGERGADLCIRDAARIRESGSGPRAAEHKPSRGSPAAPSPRSRRDQNRPRSLAWLHTV